MAGAGGGGNYTALKYTRVPQVRPGPWPPPPRGAPNPPPPPRDLAALTGRSEAAAGQPTGRRRRGDGTPGPGVLVGRG